jgi:hypothetical protein
MPDNLIDPKEAYDYFVKFYQPQRAYRQYIANVNPINPKTGKQVTRVAFWSATWKYILTHVEECKPFLRDWFGEKGIVLDEEMWKSIRWRYSKLCWEGGVRKRYLDAEGLSDYKPQEIPEL